MPAVPGRKEIRKEVRFDGYTQNLVDALMATGDFGNVADMIRTAIQTLYTKYETQQIPSELQSLSKRIISKSVAKPGEQRPITVSRNKAKKRAALSTHEEDETTEMSDSEKQEND